MAVKLAESTAFGRILTHDEQQNQTVLEEAEERPDQVDTNFVGSHLV